MGFFDTLLTIGTTIGKVAGALSGVVSTSGHEHHNRKAVSFGPRGTINPQLGSCSFFIDQNGLTQAFNNTGNQTLAISFPGGAHLKTQPLDICLGPAQQINIGPAFSDFSAAGQDGFSIIPTATNPSTESDSQKSYNSTLRSTTNQIIKDQMTVQFGTYFKISLNAQPRTVLIAVVGTMSLVGLSMLTLRGAGSTEVNIQNAVKKPGSDDDTDQQITVVLPSGIDITDGITYVEVTAQVKSTASLESYVSGNYNHRIENASEKEINYIKTLKPA